MPYHGFNFIDEVSDMLLKSFFLSPVFTVLFFAVLALPSAGAVMRGWQKPLQPGAPSQIESVLPHPLEEGRLLLAASGEFRISAEDNPDSWSTLSKIPSSKPVLTLETFPGMSEEVFAVTEDAVFRGSLRTFGWKKIFTAFGENEKLLSFAAVPEWGRWFAGTSSSLLESVDEGRSWTRSNLVPERGAFRILRCAGGRLYIAVESALYAADSAGAAEKLFSISSSPALEENDEESQEDEGNKRGILALTFSAAHSDSAWLASDAGIFETRDSGKRWKRLSQSGLKSAEIRHLVYAPFSQKLIAGTKDGIYLFESSRSIWRELYRGAAGREPADLRVSPGGGKETLLAITSEGLVFHPLDPAEFSPVPEPVSTAGLALLEQLFRLEPTARELQLAVIRYANADSSKIRRWQRESRLKSLMPSFSFGKSYAAGNSVDLDRGSTSEPDVYIIGPDDVDKRWDMDLRWDFSNLVWSSSQTSIDSREKLMIEMRHDLLGEATRIYYERRRLQMQLLLSSSPSAREHLELLTRMDELTALLDGMSGGYFGGRIESIYRNRPEFEQLWSIASLEGRPML